LTFFKQTRKSWQS